MYIKLGRLNIQLPTSDPKSANSRYFQGHQLIKPYFYHKVSRQMVVIMVVIISLPAPIALRKLIYGNFLIK